MRFSLRLPKRFIKAPAAVLKAQPETSPLKFPFPAPVPYGQIVRRQRQAKSRAFPSRNGFLAEGFQLLHPTRHVRFQIGDKEHGHGGFSGRGGIFHPKTQFQHRRIAHGKRPFRQGLGSRAKARY